MDIKQYYIFIDNFMISYGYRINTHDADDVFQRACVQALEKGDEVGGNNFFGYLKYSCLRFFRSDLPKMRHKRFDKLPDRPAKKRELTPLELSELMDEIEREIGNLPPKDRAALNMEILGITAPEAATLLGTSPMAQWVSRSRGVKTLRERLNRRG